MRSGPISSGTPISWPRCSRRIRPSSSGAVDLQRHIVDGLRRSLEQRDARARRILAAAEARAQAVERVHGACRAAIGAFSLDDVICRVGRDFPDMLDVDSAALIIQDRVAPARFKALGRRVGRIRLGSVRAAERAVLGARRAVGGDDRSEAARRDAARVPAPGIGPTRMASWPSMAPSCSNSWAISSRSAFGDGCGPRPRDVRRRAGPGGGDPGLAHVGWRPSAAPRPIRRRRICAI